MATITKRKYKSGSWVWEIRYIDPKTGKKKAKTFKNTFPKKTMNIIKKKIETELVEKNLSHTFTFLQKNKKAITLSEWFDTYIAEIPADVAISSVKRYRLAFNKFLEVMGDILIDSITEKTVEKWRKNRLASGVQQSTVNIEHRFFKACLNKAVRDKTIPINTNPFMQVKLFKLTKKLPKIIPDEDIGIFFNFVKKLSETPYDKNQSVIKRRIEKAKKDYAYFLQLYYTGMRPNEPIKFRWENLKGNTVIISDTKEKQERCKYLHPEALELLEPKESGKIFDSITTVKNMDARFKKYIKAAGLPEKYTPYWFRHTFITNALKRGINTKLVSEAVGHTTTNVTEAYYTHLQFNDTISVYQKSELPKSSKNIQKKQIKNFLSTK